MRPSLGQIFLMWTEMFAAMYRKIVLRSTSSTGRYQSVKNFCSAPDSKWFEMKGKGEAFRLDLKTQQNLVMFSTLALGHVVPEEHKWHVLFQEQLAHSIWATGQHVKRQTSLSHNGFGQKAPSWWELLQTLSRKQAVKLRSPRYFRCQQNYAENAHASDEAELKTLQPRGSNVPWQGQGKQKRRLREEGHCLELRQQFLHINLIAIWKGWDRSKEH